MSLTRYNELVSIYMDGEPNSAELDELETMLRADSGLVEDFREQLLIWETWSQENSPERSAEAFLAGFHTRLRAEDDASEFELSVTRQLQERRQPYLFQPLIAIAAVVVILLSLAVVFRPSEKGPEQANSSNDEKPHTHLVSFTGECVCTCCTLHTTEQHKRAVRYVDNKGRTQIVYLVNDPEMDMRMRHFCRGPTPVLVKGEIIEKDGFKMLAASNFTISQEKTL